MSISRTLILIALLAAAAHGQAAVFRIPSDAGLAREAAAIVVARATATRSFHAGADIVTETRFEVEDAVKGPLAAGESVVVTERGGSVGTAGQIDTAAPVYAAGEKRLLFLEPAGDGYRTHGGRIGAFSYEGPYVVRAEEHETIYGWDDQGRPWNERPRLAEEFVGYLRAIVRGEERTPDYHASLASSSVRPEVLASSPAAYVYNRGPDSGPVLPIRVRLFDLGSTITWKTFGEQARVNNAQGLQRAAAAWNGAPNVNVRFAIGGVTQKSARSAEGDYAILFNDPASEINGAYSNSNRTLAATLISFSYTAHLYGGASYYTITHADIAVQNGTDNFFDQTTFEHTMAHEMGHALGFRHSNDGVPSSGLAVMNATVVVGIGANLQEWDRDAVTALYGITAAVRRRAVARRN